MEHRIAPGGTFHYTKVIQNLAIIIGCLTSAVLLSEFIYKQLAAPQNLILIYVLAIFVISVLTNYFYSIIGTLAGVILYDYLITDPRMGFSVTVGFPLTMVMMLIVSLATCTLVNRIKVVAVKALEANRKAETVSHLIRRFIDADDQESLGQIAGEEVVSHTGRSVCFYWGDPADPGTAASLTQAEPAAGAELFTGEDRARAAARCYRGPSDYLPDRQTGILCWKLATASGALGVLCIAPGAELSQDQQDLILAIAAQMSLVLEKLMIAQSRKKAEIQAKTEQARSSLLRGISHDLRNPLTSISGAVSILLGSPEAQADPAVLELLEGIHTDTDWLLRMVENILTVTRLQSQDMQVTKHPEAPEELIAYAVSRIRKRYPGRQIGVSAPSELILAPMDPILITQVLLNFLENAVKNSQEDITVTLSQEAGEVRIAVEDRGTGIAALEGRDLFEIDPRQGGSTEDSSRGMGMGLSICKTIITAHGGSIGARNNLGPGACFWFTLPLQS